MAVQHVSSRQFRDVTIAASVGQVVISFPTVNAASTATSVQSYTDCALGDIVLPSANTSLAGLQLTAYVNAPGSITLVANNNTAAAVSLPANTTFNLLVLRPKIA